MRKHSQKISELRVPTAERIDVAQLSPRRAFVVQFREVTADAPDRFAGRVEHMVSGYAAHFRCARELTTFLRSVLIARLRAKEEVRQATPNECMEPVAAADGEPPILC
jgi:hypothetical protein